MKVSLPRLNHGTAVRNFLFHTQGQNSISTSFPHSPNKWETIISSNPANSSKSLLIRRNRPSVSAQSWAVANAYTGKIIGCKNIQNQRQIASITKIMTCLVSIKTLQQFSLPYDTMIKVSINAATTGGTSAKLRSGQQLQIWDLLHALMLPSGNDAAVCLAEFFGSFYSSKNPIKGFVQAMNETAQLLRLDDTVYCNPHGMSVPKNKSTAKDVVKLAFVAMKHKVFRQIVGTKTFMSYVIVESGYSYRLLRWENTNKLLGKGFTGVKTGITPNAGPCLCAFYKKNQQKFIVVVLNTKNPDLRWMEVPKIVEWASHQEMNRQVKKCIVSV